METSEHWTIEVSTSEHDAVKCGVFEQRHSRILLSKTDFPDPLRAEVLAAQFAMSMHGGMATQVVHCV